jgi:hypothetical protein
MKPMSGGPITKPKYETPDTFATASEGAITPAYFFVASDPAALNINGITTDKPIPSKNHETMIAGIPPTISPTVKPVPEIIPPEAITLKSTDNHRGTENDIGKC